MANLERIYTIPLGDVYDYIRTKRGKRAIKMIREFALRHMKAQDTRVSEGINSAILRDGIEKPPRKIKVRIVKGEDAIARVWLIGEEEKIKEAADKKKKAADEEKKKADEARKKAEDAKKDAAKKAEDAKKAAASASSGAAPQAKAPPAQAAAPAKPAEKK
jgi:large subunit ribosomal protein L31e